MAKVTIARVTGDGEQWGIEVEIPRSILEQKDAPTKALQIDNLVKPLYRVLDNRMIELNNRVLDGMQYAANLTSEQQFAIRRVFDIMGGREPQAIPQGVVDKDKENIASEIAKLKANGETIEGGKVIPFPVKTEDTVS